MTEERRRPVLVPIQREEADDAPTRVSGNGHGPETPTDPPRRLGDLDPDALDQDTAVTVELVHERLKRFDRKWSERSERVEDKVDTLIGDGRELRADARRTIAICLENRAEIQETKAGVLEILGLLRPVEAMAKAARADAAIARKEAAISREDAKRGIQLANAARNDANRSSKTEEELIDMGLSLARGAVTTIHEHDRLTVQSAGNDITVRHRARLGGLKVAISFLAGVSAAAIIVITTFAKGCHL